MLFYLIVAGFVLPTVLEGCCLPRKMKATLSRNTEEVLLDFLIDFRKKKFMFGPQDGSYTFLVDYRKNLKYNISRDGTCRRITGYSLNSKIYRRCLTRRGRYTKAFSGQTQGLTLDTYISKKVAGVQQAITVNSANCVPVYDVMTIGGNKYEHIYMDVSTTKVDTSGLDVDTTKCPP